MVVASISVLALLTGATLCGVFALLQVPIHAPPELPGVLGIVVGYRLVETAGWSADLLGAIGL